PLGFFKSPKIFVDCQSSTAAFQALITDWDSPLQPDEIEPKSWRTVVWKVDCGFDGVTLVRIYEPPPFWLATCPPNFPRPSTTSAPHLIFITEILKIIFKCIKKNTTPMLFRL